MNAVNPLSINRRLLFFYSERLKVYHSEKVRLQGALRRRFVKRISN